MIKLPISIGDTILTGKFRNKKTVVKHIGKNELGLPTVNGKVIVNYRYYTEPEPEQVKEHKTIMKVSQFKNLIREEVKSVIKEDRTRLAPLNSAQENLLKALYLVTKKHYGSLSDQEIINTLSHLTTLYTG